MKSISKKFKLCVLAGITLALLGCGGGTPQEDEPLAKEKKTLPVHLCLYGDSTQIWNHHTGLLEALPEGSRLSNRGVAGATAIQQLRGYAWVYPNSWEQEMKNDCNIVTVNFGINDAAKLGWSADVFVGQIIAIKSIAESNGKVFVIETPNPTKHPVDYLISQYAGAEMQVQGYKVDHYTLFKGFNGGNWTQGIADYVHPTGEGYAFKTEALKGVILKVLDENFTVK
jgi:lysophospholipase L1-like esterase